MTITGAVEVHDKAPGRLCLKVIDDHSTKTLGSFVGTNLMPGSPAISDGLSAASG